MTDEIVDQKPFIEDFKLGHPVAVVLVNDEDHSFSLDEDAICSILTKKEVSGLPIVVISVAGAFRKGKSFLLNFLLRYLKNYNNENWIEDSSEELFGFVWRGGSERMTTGIWLWSEVFVIDLPSGEKVGVIIMDTQGAFDSSSTVKDCATVFALSTMTSSVQVYNLSQNIQEDDFQNLELFTEYGRLALEESDFKPFQSLLFLIRDWSFPYEFGYGLEGGNKLLQKRLDLAEEEHLELHRVRTHIKSCFTDLSCFLMPHPGLSVACNPHFKGNLNDISQEFREYIQKLASSLLQPENLKTKQINGETVTCSQLVEYFRAYIKIYDGEILPEPKTMLQATAEANNLSAVAKSRDLYCDLMDQVCGSSSPYLNPNVLQEKHQENEKVAIECFDSTRKMGGNDFSVQYREKLAQDIMELHDNYIQTNSAKNVFKNLRTPAVYFSFAVLFYLLTGLLEFLYFNILSTLSYIAALLFIISISLWAYVQFTGQYQEVGQALDRIADAIWESLLQNLSASLVEQGSQYVNRESVQQLATKVKVN